MHLYAIGELIRGRELEPHRSARRYTPPRQFHPRHGSIRHRTGRVLIEIGLALVQGCSDA